MNMKRLIACIIATMALSSLSAQTNPLKTFFCADFNQGKIFEFQDGKIVWEHKAPTSNDVWVLKNGNRLFTTGHGVLEVTVEKIPFSTITLRRARFSLASVLRMEIHLSESVPRADCWR